MFTRIELFHTAAAIALAFLLFAVRGVAQAQSSSIPAETVSWTVSAPADVKSGGKVTLTLRGAVVEGWYVYSLKQQPLGPNPLHVSLGSKDLASIQGAVSESAPVKKKDPAFGFETQYFDKPFTVNVPVQVAKDLAPGQQTIPVKVSFQTCNGRICQPPKTVQLSAPVNVKAGA